jgi:hypothetical protein
MVYVNMTKTNNELGLLSYVKYLWYKRIYILKLLSEKYGLASV